MTSDPAVDHTAFAPLTPEDVARRVAAGDVNDVENVESRSIASILAANIFTRFNAIITVLLVLILVFGEPADALFGFVMVINALIGIVQELRAKLTLDRLRVVAAPRVEVVRSEGTCEIPSSEVVLGDVVRIARGDQAPVDGVVIESHGLEMSEALLTGEADAVPKHAGDPMLSGSFAVAGSGSIGVTAVGDAAYANQLADEARKFVLSSSPLREAIDQILRFVTWLLVPTSALLFWSQIQARPSIEDGIVGAVAGVVAMVPQGLVLLVSISLAVAVIRLGERNVLVQELPAVEMLARVDTLCIDKTGTLTTGAIRFVELAPLGGNSVDAALSVVGDIAACDPDPNPTMLALQRALPSDPREVRARVPFSSARKLSAVAFADGSAWAVGAPEFVLGRHDFAAAETTIARYGAAGMRVVAVASCDPVSVEIGDPVPEAALCLAVFEEDIRSDAAETVEYFHRQGVELKVISGDAVSTVEAVAASTGVNVHASTDMSTIGNVTGEDLGALAIATTVFGRVTPEQKRDLVDAMQAEGRVVAMTGDGVNDVLALKHADMGIAMGGGSAATRAVAQLILLDDRFASLPPVVGEGRRIVANMERVASLFLTKTVYATLLALFIGVVGLAFPFLPRHMTLVGALTIGIPAFILSFEDREAPIRRGFIARVLSFALPAGLVSALSLFLLYGISRIDALGFTVEESRASATTLMILLGLVVLYELVDPPSPGNTALIAALFVGYLFVLAVPITRDVFDLTIPRVFEWVVIGLAAVVSGFVLRFLLDVSRRRLTERLLGITST